MRIPLVAATLSLLAVASHAELRLNDGSVRVETRPPAFGDAPYSHRRLFGIRRLKVLRPIAGTMQSPLRATNRRRQQARFVESSEELLNSFVPRAQAPPGLVPVAVPPSRPIEGGSQLSSRDVDVDEDDDDDDLRTTRVVVQNPSKFGATMDESRRKRIEARWKRLGINFRNVNYPYRNPNSREFEHVMAVKGAQDQSIHQLNLPAAGQNTRGHEQREIYREIKGRPRIQGPILRVISVPEDETPPQANALPAAPQPTEDYHSRTRTPFKGVKFTQEKLSVRPRLRIRRPGAALPTVDDFDPNLTPFMNSARAKFGYGTPQPLPIERQTAPPATTTTSTSTTTEATTTAATAEEPEEEEVEETGDSGTAPAAGGDSGAGFGFGPSELPPEFANVGFGVGGGDNGFNFNVPANEMDKKAEEPTTQAAPRQRLVQRKPPNPEFDKDVPVAIPQNSGLRAVAPPKDFEGGGGFGSGSGGSFGGSGGGNFGGSGGGSGLTDPDFGGGNPTASNRNDGDFFTGDSALTPSRGPTGDGYGPPVFPGGAAPPAVPSVGLGGAAAGKSPYGGGAVDATENPPTTVKPSALLSVLNKADLGFNQAIDHFEHGTPVETAAIDILEVALGSQKLDSQAKLLGHVDRTIGLDNLQRIQRWANTAGAMEIFKEQFVKFAKNFQPPADLLPTVPPQLEYLFKTSG